MDKRFPPMWPRTHRVFDPKVHAHAGYHTFGAADEKTECYGSNVSAFCDTNIQWCISVDMHSMVETSVETKWFTENYEFTRDAIQFMCFIDSLLSSHGNPFRRSSFLRGGGIDLSLYC